MSGWRELSEEEDEYYDGHDDDMTWKRIASNLECDVSLLLAWKKKKQLLKNNSSNNPHPSPEKNAEFPVIWDAITIMSSKIFSLITNTIKLTAWCRMFW